jgi:hypothetical protein
MLSKFGVRMLFEHVILWTAHWECSAHGGKENPAELPGGANGLILQ